MYRIILLAAAFIAGSLQAQTASEKFKQLKEELATPNMYRSASGAPGPNYYQQQADYNIDLTLDDKTQKVYGEEVITYTNNSPDNLDYIWIQLDQNMRANTSDANKIRQMSMDERMSFGSIIRAENQANFEGGFNIEKVETTSGKALDYIINKTMMRVDLPSALQSGQRTSLRIKWWYNINNRMEIGGRSGYEYFEEEDNYLYTIAQFYPRMAVYNEVEGWQHKQFLGSGEFALPFGNFDVSITVPADHIVGSTGELQNASQVLTSEQRKRWAKAADSDVPVEIVTQAEAEEAEKSKSEETKTWNFKATNVRDFAFATSRKFIWDAMQIEVGGNKVWCMSYYPKEGNPLWGKYSTRVVAHTIKTYSKYTIDYNYPVAISVHTKWIGMEYPMICFNGGRPEADGTYSAATKYGMQSVIIHEVGHNFFPMIINSDERQWTWMDEGLNTFVQYLTEQEWDVDYPSRRGPANKIVPYMAGDQEGMVPIMTNSESLLQFGNNAYAKPATALNILRETVMGRELFDHAFKTYSERWAFKHPTPSDFFRSMEDASGVDLDWFWRGWFYTTDYCDQALESVKWYRIDTKNPEVEMAIEEEMHNNREKAITEIRNADIAEQTILGQDTSMRDFYNNHSDYEFTQLDVDDYKNYESKLSERELSLLNSKREFYEIKIRNEGELVMPVILRFTFEDGSEQVEYIPAEIWARNDELASKVYWFDQQVVQVTLDPYIEIADIDRSNNYWPARQEPTRFELYKSNGYSRYSRGGAENPMQRYQRAMKEQNKTDDE